MKLRKLGQWLCAVLCAGGVICLSLQAPQAQTVQPQSFQALARVDMDRSGIADQRGGRLAVRLGLSQPVPYRVFTLTDPARLVIDFQEVDWQGFDRERFIQTDSIGAMRFGIYRPGWSRLVAELPGLLGVETSDLRIDRTRGTADLEVVLSPISPTEFAAQSGAPLDQAWAVQRPDQAAPARKRQVGDRPIVVVIDPGHGGVDPGARANEWLEKDLVLAFARELKEALLRTGRFKAEMTRNEDIFLSLPERISIARALNADVFVSLHADALREGTASGATVYTLSDRASDAAAEDLARQHDRDDLLAGVDLSEQDDLLATVLMDMARLETQARSDMLAEMLVSGIAHSIGRIRKRPHLTAGFSVLKAADIPSVLIELGFMSNRVDLLNLLSPKWRAQVIEGIILALDDWVVEDAAQARLLRQ